MLYLRCTIAAKACEHPPKQAIILGAESDYSDPVQAQNKQYKTEIASHQAQLEALKQQDPEFYEYLQQTDQELLNFGQDDDEEEEGAGEEMEEASEDEQVQSSVLLLLFAAFDITADDIPLARRGVSPSTDSLVATSTEADVCIWC